MIIINIRLSNEERNSHETNLEDLEMFPCCPENNITKKEAKEWR